MLCCAGRPGAGSTVVPQQAGKVARRPSLFEALDELDLQNILADPADRVHLRRWARRFSCLAPIDFLIELSELHAAIEGNSIDSVQELASRIARTYLARDAQYTVCDDIGDGLQRKMIDALSFTSADSAMSIIYQVKKVMLRFIQSDIMTRFKESDDFKAMRNLHPRYVLVTMNLVREAFLESVSQAEKDAVLLWHSACQLQDQQAELDRKTGELLRQSVFIGAANSQLKGLGLGSASPLHMGMTSAMRSSMRKVQDSALSGFVEAYADFIVGPRGRELILKSDPDPEVKICFDTLSPCERFELCSLEDITGTESDYAAGW